MAETLGSGNGRGPTERSTAEIRRDIEAKGENVSRTVEQISERIGQTLDWRRYVKESPFWAVGAAAGLGFIAAQVIRHRTTPMERVLKSLDASVRHAGGSLNAGIARPSLVKATLMGIAAQVASNWIKEKTTPGMTGREAASRPQAGLGATSASKTDKTAPAASGAGIDSRPPGIGVMQASPMDRNQHI